MSFLRSSTTFSNLTRRAALSTRALSSTPSRFAQGYGDGNGDPTGDTSQDQGSSNYEKHKRELPGSEPPPPSKGPGTGSTKAGKKAPEDASVQPGDSRSKDPEETGSSRTGGSIDGGRGMDGPSPKIRDRSQPEASDAEKQAEVEQHNREFEQRYDRGPPAPEDAVDKRYWSGEFEEPRSRRLLITFTRSRREYDTTDRVRIERIALQDIAMPITSWAQGCLEMRAC